MSWEWIFLALYVVGFVLSWRATVRWVHESEGVSVGEIFLLGFFALSWPLMVFVIYSDTHSDPNRLYGFRKFLLAVAGVSKEKR